jgi:NDP-sugar pyrophosphorylase family protein
MIFSSFSGARARIEGSYVWDGATVAEGAVIKHSIVCKNAKILPNSRVDMSLISYDVTASFSNN